MSGSPQAPNPPSVTMITGGTTTTPVTFGTILRYGVDSVTITGLLVDSYSRSAKYANKEEIVGQYGIVEGIRMSDARVEVSVSGRLKNGSTNIAMVGSVLSINGDNLLIEDISMSAGSKEFTKVDIKATGYEGVAGIEPSLG